MFFNALPLALVYATQRPRVGNNEALKLGLISSIVRPPVLGIVLGTAIGQAETPISSPASARRFQIEAVALSDKHIILIWPPIAGADNYQVIRDGKHIGSPTRRTGHSDHSLEPGEEYKYEVDALYKGNVIANGTVSVSTLPKGQAATA